MKNVYITYAKRSPIGKFKGALSSMRVDDLLAILMSDLKSEINFDPALISDVIVGCANQAGEDNRNLARMSMLLADFPHAVPATTINRLCGSSLDATISAFARIQAGMGECFMVGGAEGMSRAPYVLSKAEGGFDTRQQLFDTALGWRFPNKKMAKIFPLTSMGETAENIVDLHNISREDQDLFAFNSHKKAVQAQKTDAFTNEILPITIPAKSRRASETIFSTDEGPRAETTLEKLSTLKPAFREGGSVTAGNSSSLNDGAALVLVVSEEFLKQHNLTPLVRITGGGVRGVHPNVMGLGPVEATKALCKQYNHQVTDFDIVELNEAFAAQSLGCIKELDLDPSRVNLNGGAIALGHPLGCSGARILTTLTHLMQSDATLKKGLATMCIGVGQGIALSVENCR